MPRCRPVVPSAGLRAPVAEPGADPAAVLAAGLWSVLLLGAGTSAAVAGPRREQAAPVQTIERDALQQRPPSRALEQAINQLRHSNGVPPLAPVPPALQGLSTSYGREILQDMLQGRPCDHDLERWQAFQKEVERIEVIRPLSETLGCPKPSQSWSAAGLVQLWSGSSTHNRILNRADRSHLSCEVVDRQNRTAALCILWQGPP
jgi:hypothetical protein